VGECDLCGREDGGVETLGFDHRDRGTPEDFWRVARVCEGCREGRLMPALRRLFGGGLNLGEPDGDAWEPVAPSESGALFFAFEGADAWHVARSVLRADALPDERRCVGHCGIERRAEPEARSRPLRARREGIVVCARCAKSAPQYVGGRA
jgi:hypothetical protein